MSNNEETPQENTNQFKVITYIDEVAFNYTLPDEDEPRTIEHEVTIVFEDTLEEFLQEHGKEKSYKIHEFKRQREQNMFIERIEGLMDDLIDEVQEDIANKMKFGFDFSGQLHNDD